MGEKFVYEAQFFRCMLHGFPGEPDFSSSKAGATLSWAACKAAFLSDGCDENYSSKLKARKGFYCPRPPLKFECKANAKKGGAIEYKMELTDFEEPEKINVSISEEEVRVEFEKEERSEADMVAMA